MAKAAVLLVDLQGGPDPDSCTIFYKIGSQATLNGQVEISLLDASSVQQAAIRQAVVNDLAAFGQANNGFPVYSASDVSLCFNIV